MKIAIDARLINETGVGRYIRNLITKLRVIDTKNTYVVFLLPKDLHSFVPPNARWHARVANVHWHSIQEQFIMPWLFWKEHVDMVHIPYFNVPIFYFGKFIVTIHDLTILHTHTGKASTLPYWKYLLRWIAYRCILWMSIYRSSKIITVSQTVKDDIIVHFPKSKHKISVTYEGVDDSLIQLDKKNLAKSPIESQYFLYVGNVYPHKNVEVLLQAFKLLQKNISKKLLLVFV